ncbi:alpha/beta hydrolase [Tothia fuscella]|uniref:Alpha/beta hydrolase n=1 Tax=Tothia fuscella TaxID=1048955 RepID=A0A9P4NRS6_9PEZI|nr:alpha/beta hydrolase [Tothia fuscella]
MKLGAGFTDFSINVEPEVTIHGTRAGSGPPLLLLHGFPQTHLIWHKVASHLTSSYTVVAIDLRGYGASSKPTDDGSHRLYSKSTMARDVAAVMKELGYDKYFVCGHDRGGRVAHKLCVDFPEEVRKVMVLDIAPTLVMYEGSDQEFATKYWHWFFLIQPMPFPEHLMMNHPETFMEKFIGPLPSNTTSADGEVFHPDAVKEYVEQMRDIDGVHGMCEDYRAGATVDLDEQRGDIKEGRKIQCPLYVIWGKKGLIEKKYDAIAEWKKVSSGGVEGKALACGHYIPEELPDELLEIMEGFFK